MRTQVTLSIVYHINHFHFFVAGPATLTATITVTSRTATVSWEIIQSGGFDISHFEMEIREIAPAITTWRPTGGEIPGYAVSCIKEEGREIGKGD